MEFYEKLKKFKNKNGEEFSFFLQSDYVLIKDKKENSIGEFNFKELDYDRGFKLTHAYINNGYTKTGLGKAALLYFKDFTDADIYVSLNYEPQDDGSHITAQGEIFVKKMLEKEVVLDMNLTNGLSAFIEPRDSF